MPAIATATGLLTALVVGGLSVLYPGASVALVSVFVVAVLLRFRLLSISRVSNTTVTEPDWILILLPTVLALRTFSGKASVVILLGLVTVAYLRRSTSQFNFRGGPLILFVAASLIVFARPGPLASFGVPLVITILVVALATRLAIVVDGRRIIVSLIDGCGLYLAANVAGAFAGLSSPASASRIGGLVENTGFIRTIFPFTYSINVPPVIAGIYIAAFGFLIIEQGWLRRSVRVTFLLAGLIVLAGAGTRMPMITALVVSVAVISYPSVCRWIGQVLVVLTSVSALFLPAFAVFADSVVSLLISLAPGRANDAQSISTLNGRDYIWDQAIQYWQYRVTDFSEMAFGYGVNGQYRSGASQAYSDRLIGILRNPEQAFVHNTFLQQLYDGGLVGCALLLMAAFWASVRLATRCQYRGDWGFMAVSAMTVLILSGMTEVAYAPGPAQDPYWIMMILIALSCQGVRTESPAASEIATGIATSGEVGARHNHLQFGK